MHLPIKRSRNDRVFAGVLGGLAKHFGWNSNLLRIIYVILTPTSWFAGIPVYLILWLLMEEED
ncbi:PspC domain-containing protein [Lactobacillus sp. YT155]|uniref:PspC domain-containing protein n=1 Tax=Lactobacillus sp. YT155 TaxID=3060955 RepID=UPI00265EA159|nr:PspC domain-containing protein [Lactobacillus sp. YT155]MDO1605028.1 PspC domain-containing protein [Lactobacillus sp. YT155]